jgi:hypothetical protein
MRFTVGHQGGRHAKDLHHLRVGRASREVNQVLLVSNRGGNIQDGIEVRTRGVVRACSKVL